MLKQKGGKKAGSVARKAARATGAKQVRGNRASRGGTRNGKLIVGNWKMNPATPAEVKAILAAIKKAAARAAKAQVVVCPSLVHEGLVLAAAGRSKVGIGAQDVFQKSEGSFTGAVSAPMLAAAGIQYVIVGHSERRALGEGFDVVREKLGRVLAADMIAILCIGEARRDGQGVYLEEIKKQIRDAFHDVDVSVLGRIVVAYEPIWTIGAKEAMQTSQIHEMTIYIRKVLLEKYPADAVKKVRVLYGGSVAAANAAAILGDGEADGLLIGRQSLVAEDFSEIIRIADAL